MQTRKQYVTIVGTDIQHREVQEFSIENTLIDVTPKGQRWQEKAVESSHAIITLVNKDD